MNSWLHKAKVIEYYNNISSSYDELYGEEQKNKYNKVFNVIKNHYMNKVLDYGCGTGLLLEYLCYNANIQLLVGIDISNGMLSKAKEKLSYKVDLILCDGEYLPLRNNSFDTTFMITVFQNLYNKELGLGKAISATKPNGLLIISVPNRGNLKKELLIKIFSQNNVELINKINEDKDFIIIMKKKC